MAAEAPLGEGILRRSRRRRRDFGLSVEDRQKLGDRVVRLYHSDLSARGPETDQRLQRYAKYRQWRGEDTGYPWPGSSNQAVPDLFEASIRMQDTLHNAVMSARPVIVSRALQKQDEPKQRTIDALHDTQLFIEQDGERIIEHAAENFCNDPALTLSTSYVTERRMVIDTRVFDPIPDVMVPRAYFSQILRQEFPEHGATTNDDEGWDWTITKGDEERDVRFYTRGEDGDVEMVVRVDAIVFDGPKVTVWDYSDVIVPPGIKNLDIPGPSNPGGAPHVILRDRPTKDEIRRLVKRDGDRPAFYDLLDKEGLDRLMAASFSDTDGEDEDQKDALQGVTESRPQDSEKQTVTRLVCYDVLDVRGNGETEDVVMWVIKETKQLLRIRHLTDVFPGAKPERPLASTSFLPVGGRRAGISLLESMEGLHDFMKETIDQMVDNGTLVNLPWFSYRATSSIKPETLRPGPGDGIPMSDPKNDIQVHQFRSDGQAFWLNLVTMIRQQAERLSLQGDLQAGRVPGGASSALRTLGGIQTLLSQGEARPERILRRFFMAWSRVFRQMHRLNRYFLSDEKRFRAAPELTQPGEDPYLSVASVDLDVDLEFDFHANVLNSSKQAVQQGLQQLAGMYVSDVAVQMGLTTPETVYRLMRDLGQAFGQDVDDYLQAPTPAADLPRLVAAEAIMMLAEGVFPVAEPAEGAAAHLAAIGEIEQSEVFGAFPPQFIPMLRSYMEQLAQRAQQEAQLAARAEAAGGLGEPVGQSRGQPGRPPEGPPAAPRQAPLQGQELADETLPSA